MNPSSSHCAPFRPVIGISTGYDPLRSQLYVNFPYLNAIERAGGIPLIFPTFGTESIGGEFLNEVDALVLVGGQDITPSLYGELPQPGLGAVVYERDLADLALAREAFRRRLPMLGICKGMQVMNVAAGGTLLQDIASAIAQPLEHRQRSLRGAVSPWHRVEVAASSRLAAIVGAASLEVNSAHHQSVARVAPGFRVSATAPDGVIEAMESEDPDWFALGLQWHPELLAAAYPSHLAFFKALADAALSEAERKSNGVQGDCAGRAEIALSR